MQVDREKRERQERFENDCFRAIAMILLAGHVEQRCNQVCTGLSAFAKAVEVTDIALAFMGCLVLILMVLSALSIYNAFRTEYTGSQNGAAPKSQLAHEYNFKKFSSLRFLKQELKASRMLYRCYM